MKKQIKIMLAVLALAVVVGGIVLARYLNSLNTYRIAVDTITYEHASASGIPNGVYVGEYDVDFIYAKVEVTVLDGAIAGIQLLEHRHDRGAAAEGIEQEIVRQQRIDVDAVSGASNSSRVIKKAVDVALSSALQG